MVQNALFSFDPFIDKEIYLCKHSLSMVSLIAKDHAYYCRVCALRNIMNISHSFIHYQKDDEIF